MENLVRHNVSSEIAIENISSLIEKITTHTDEIDTELNWLNNQVWYERAWYTFTGKNKLTKNEIERNTLRCIGDLSSVMTLMLNVDNIQFAAIRNLDTKITGICQSVTELYKTELHTKSQVAEIKIIQAKTLKNLEKCALKLNNKINNMENFILLLEEIKQGEYSSFNNFSALCRIIEELDSDTFNNNRKLKILKTELAKQNIISDDTLTITQIIEDILNLNENDLTCLGSDLVEYSNTYPADILLESIKQALNEHSEDKNKIINNILNKYKDKTTDSISTTFIFDSLIETQKEKNKKNLEIINLFSFDPAMRIKVLASTIKEHKDPREFNKDNYDSVSKLYLYLNEQLKFNNIDVDIAMDKEFGFCFHPMAETVINNINDFSIDLGELLLLDDEVRKQMDLCKGNISMIDFLIITKFSGKIKNLEECMRIVKGQDFNVLFNLIQERYLAFIGALQELGNKDNPEALMYLGCFYDPFLKDQIIDNKITVSHKDYLKIHIIEGEVKICRTSKEKAMDYYVKAALAGNKGAINRIYELHDTKTCTIPEDIFEDIRIADTKKPNMVKMMLNIIDIEKCEEFLLDFKDIFEKIGLHMPN